MMASDKMCEYYIRDYITGKPIDIPKMKYNLTVSFNNEKHDLLKGIEIDQTSINYAECKKIVDLHGFKEGYIFIIGNK